MSNNTIKHRSTIWSIEKDHFDLKFENGEQMLELNSTKNGHNYNALTELNREDLINLRNVIDEYLLKTAKPLHIE